MLTASADGLTRGQAVVLIGSDCPEFDPGYLEAAFAALAQQDAVLGPAVDGGYLLIGLRAAPALLFEDIAWGTPQVLAVTRDRLRQLDALPHALAVLLDAIVLSAGQVDLM